MPIAPPLVPTQTVPSRRGKPLWLVGGLVVMLLIAGAAVAWWGTRPSADELARRDARLQAEGLRVDLLDSVQPGAGRIREIAGARTGVTVLSVEGTDRRRPPGIEVRFRVHVEKSTGGVLGYGARTAVVDVCFRLEMGESMATSPLAVVSCSAPVPPSIASSLPADVEQRVRGALARVASRPPVNRAAVDEAMAGLGLDPRVYVETADEGRAVGVALRAGGVCVLGRVVSGRAEAWRVAAIQFQPGELSCAPSEAIAGHGQQSPK